MESKGNWFSSVKKAFSPESKEKKNQKSKKSKKKWFGKEKPTVPDSPSLDTVTAPHPLSPPEELNLDLTEVEDEQDKHAYSAPVAADVAAESPVAAVQAAAEVVPPTAMTQLTGEWKEEVAAIKIQTAFRGYMGKKGIEGFERACQAEIIGTRDSCYTANFECFKMHADSSPCAISDPVQKDPDVGRESGTPETAPTETCKRTKFAEIGEEWDDSLQSKEQIEANLLGKYEAAIRRERALAYSFSHQQNWKKSTRSATLLFMDPTNPHWGWSWLDRWMEARPWETQSTTEKEFNNDQLSTKSASLNLAGGEITKAYARHQLNSDKPSPTSTQKPNRRPSHRSPSTPPSKSASSTVSRKLKPASPKGNMFSPDSDGKSMFSVQLEKNRRHSIAGSSVRDDESLASSLGVPSFMAPTKSAKAKSRMQRPLGLENGTLPEKESAGPAKKRLSFPASPARPPRRHSGPPKVEVSSIAEKNVTNGGVSQE
ncbi:unnamed protein product [Camellia sinensis]